MTTRESSFHFVIRRFSCFSAFVNTKLSMSAIEDIGTKSSWTRMYCSNTNEHDARKTVASYDKYSEYEEDMKNLGHIERTPVIVANHVMKHMTAFGAKANVLDVGAGTGLVGATLRKEGFKGNLFGIDGSSGMLEKAKEKATYDGLFCEFIDKSTVFPTNLGHYDAIVSVAAFNVGYIHYDVIPNMLKVVKTNGVFVISVKSSIQHPEYKEQFQEQLNYLAKNGEIIIIEIVPIDCYYVVNYEDAENGDNNHSTATLYCFKKC